MARPGNVFHDLEIPVSKFMDTEDDAKKFALAVYESATKLNTILDEQSTPASQIEDTARDQFRNNPEFRTQLKETFGEVLDTIYTSCDELPMPVVAGLAEALRKLANDLDNTLHDRAKRESLTMTESISDKKMAQIQLRRLSESWEPIRKVLKLMFGLEFKGVKSRPGNYAGSANSTTAFFMPGSEDPMYNPFAVARLLGVYYDKMTLMDVLEYCEKNPDKVTMKIVNL